MRRYVNTYRRTFEDKAGKKHSKAPKIQRLVTPVSVQRKRRRASIKKARIERSRTEAAEYVALAAGELARAADVMAQHPMALQLRNLQTLVEISVDKNSTVIFPAPLMTTIEEIGSFLTRETKAAAGLTDIIDALKR